GRGADVPRGIETSAHQPRLRHAHGSPADLVRRVVKAHRLDAILADLYPGTQSSLLAEQRERQRVADARTADVPVIVLLDLVAVREVGEVGEVRKEIEVIVEEIGSRAPDACTRCPPRLARHAPAMRNTAIARVHVAEPGDEP